MTEEFFLKIAFTLFVIRSSNRELNGVRLVRAACHVHSKWSYDGKWALSAIAQEFGRRGHQVVMMSEHDRGFTEARWCDYQSACTEASSRQLLLVPGIEYSDPANVVHVLVWGCSAFLGENLSTTELLANVRDCGGVAVMAHPARRAAWKLFDPSWTKNLLGIELWNRKTDGWIRSSVGAELLATTGLAPFVGLDFHESKQLFPLAMDLHLSDDTLSEKRILESIRERNFAAMAFGQSVDSFLRGIKVPMLEASEYCRRRMASVYRTLKKGSRQ